MELKPFVAKNVSPGEPVTAQAWNALVTAIDGAYKFLQAGMHVVKVTITTPGLDPGHVRVLALRAAGVPFESVPPAPPDTVHVLSGLEPGAYTLVAIADGYTPDTKALTIADAGETALEMAPVAVGPFMPDLFGQPLGEALDLLSTAQIPVTGVLDFNGQQLPPHDPGAETLAALVLVQSPAAGLAVSQGVSASLVVALPIPVTATVEVPSLSGLTQTEAQKALEAVGLVLGRVEIRQSPR